jgi:hypothetical protein
MEHLVSLSVIVIAFSLALPLAITIATDARSKGMLFIFATVTLLGVAYASWLHFSPEWPQWAHWGSLFFAALFGVENIACFVCMYAVDRAQTRGEELVHQH